MVERWGSYYEQQPETGYVCIAQHATNFGSHTGLFMFENLVIKAKLPPKQNPVTAKKDKEDDYAMA